MVKSCKNIVFTLQFHLLDFIYLSVSTNECKYLKYFIIRLPNTFMYSSSFNCQVHQFIHLSLLFTLSCIKALDLLRLELMHFLITSNTFFTKQNLSIIFFCVLVMIVNARSRFKHQLCFKIASRIIRVVEFLPVLSAF